ncbi:hypothetical protein [Pseudolysinimonas sp.]|uniref:hypothetical protein n=1 Tax=Pseudolysinimonas sp. TaxID=2680009 RepID=UPI00286C537D|nr:hypothetical protein [Pseudolysinimonas sp.]
MTTYQDPPLQSRRAVRQGERVDPSAPPFAPPQTPRTAAGAGEPLSYVTQNRPPLPGYDSAPSRGRRSSTPEPQAPQAAPEPPAPQSFRPRDFSPEARTAPPAWAPDYERDSGALDHHTQARAPMAPLGGGSLAASLASEPSEQTLTRRELRAIRDIHGITAVPTDATPIVEQPAAYLPQPAAYVPPAPAAYQPPAAPYQPAVPPQPQPAPVYQAPPVAQVAPPAPAPSTQLDSAMAEFDALSGSAGVAPSTSRRDGRRAAPNADVAPEDGLGAFDAMFAPPVAQAPAQQVPQQQVPQQQMPQQQMMPQLAPPVAEQYPVVLPQAPAPTTGERPIGHWTTQADIDDRTQVNESKISRRVGSGAITTSALVLPSIPGHNMTTGEVMLTDSISLPSALSSTGAHSPIDESDIDHLLDPGDHQLVNTDSVPIRAIRAVSSHTGTRGQVIANSKPTQGNRALTALIVSASGMVVVVVTLLVVALATEVI